MVLPSIDIKMNGNLSFHFIYLYAKTYIILQTNFHVKFLLNFQVNQKSLVVKEVLALNVVTVNLSLVLNVGVAAVLVVLHEAHLGPLNLPLDSELSLFVSADPREVSTV